MAERDTATWIAARHGDAQCSACGFWQSSVYDWDNWQRYCGHCGKEMTNMRVALAKSDPVDDRRIMRHLNAAVKRVVRKGSGMRYTQDVAVDGEIYRCVILIQKG